MELEALGVAAFLFEYKGLPKAKAIESIKADRTVAEAVRAKAQAFSEQRRDNSYGDANLKK